MDEQKKIRVRASSAGEVSRAVGGREDFVCDEPERDPRRTVGPARAVSPLARVVHALREEGIRFQIAGMSAAILQGVPATTLDTDIWVELPVRRFVRLTEMILRLGGTMLAPTVAALSDDTMVNFLPRVDGLGEFGVEYGNTKRLRWQGMNVPVLPLESILKSKQKVGRPKDRAHIPLIRQVLRLQRAKKKTA